MNARALLDTLSIENHGRLGGRDRLATICFDSSAPSVLRGKREVRHG